MIVSVLLSVVSYNIPNEPPIEPLVKLPPELEISANLLSASGLVYLSPIEFVEEVTPSTYPN